MIDIAMFLTEQLRINTETDVATTQTISVVHTATQFLIIFAIKLFKVKNFSEKGSQFRDPFVYWQVGVSLKSHFDI